MPVLPELEPVVDPASGILTTAVRKDTIRKPASTIPPARIQPQPPAQARPQIRPEIQQVIDEMRQIAGTSPPTTQIRPEIQQVIDEMRRVAGTTPQSAPVPEPAPIPAPVAPPATDADIGFLQKSVESWKVGWANYLANKLRGTSVLPGVRDEWLMGKADQMDALVTPEMVQRVNELTGGQLEMNDFWGIVKQLPKIGWYGMIQNSPQMFDAMIANKVGGSLGGAIGGVGGPKGAAIGKLIGGYAAGTASAGLTEAGAFKQEQIQALCAAGIDEATVKMLGDTVVDKYARLYGPAAGVVEYASNIFQLGKATKGLRKTAIQTLRKTPIWKLILDPLTGGLSEGGEELSQGWLSQQAANLMWDEVEKITGRKFARPKDEGLLRQGISGFAVGTMMGAMGLPVNIVSKRSQDIQAAEQKTKDIAQYKADLRVNLINLGIPADVITRSKVLDKMVMAEGEIAREKVMNDFADQNLAGKPTAEPAKVPLAEPPVTPPPPPMGGEIAPLPGKPAPKVIPSTGLPAEVVAKPTKPPTITQVAPSEAITPKPKPAIGEKTIEAPAAATEAPIAPETTTPGGYRKRGLASAIQMRRDEPQGSLENYDDRSQTEWLGGKTPPSDRKLILYRATPTGEPIEPGDYVTNEIAYARKHITANLGGKGKITRIEATLDDIFPADAPKEFWYVPKSIETLPPPAPKPEITTLTGAKVPTPAKAEVPTTMKSEVGAGVISTEGKPDIQQSGTDTRVSGARGESYNAKYAVVPREALIASHDTITFAKNPLYPLVNPRDYSSLGEQEKVLNIRQKFAPDEHVVDAVSAAVGPVMAAHVTDEQGNRRLIVLGGNTREMVTQSISTAEKKALADFTNERASGFGIKPLLDADHELIRYMGEYDLRQPGVRKKLQNITDALNPSPGKVQNIMEMATVDADVNIKPEHLTGITADITPEDAQARVEKLIADGIIDSSTRGLIAEHPVQAHEYLRRVLVNAAFRNPVLAKFATTTDRKKMAGRGMVEASTATVIELRRKGQGEMADAFGRTMAEVAGYMKKGDNLQTALRKAAEQTDFDPRYAIVLDIAREMRNRIALGKRGQINTDETIDNLASLWDRVDLAIQQWEESDMFGERQNVEDVIRTVMNVIKEEQAAMHGIPGEETKGASVDRTRRESRKKVKAVDLTPILKGFEKEMPFTLVGERVPAVKPPAPIPKKETQPELFIIQRIVQSVDPEKSANMAEQLYGGPERALKTLKRQLSIINTDSRQKLSFPKEARERLNGVFDLMEQRIREKKRESIATTGEMPTVQAKTAQSVVDQYTKKWRNKPKGGILVVQSEEDVDALNLAEKSMRAIGEYQAEGFYHIPTDTVVIIADNIERTSDAIRVALHESIVHSGLRNMLGADFEAELERIGKDIPENELSDIALRYDLDLSKVDDRLEAYEEYLGKYAPTRNPTLWQRFLAAIRRALRALGLNEHLTDAFDRRGDVDRLVDAGREYVERGRRIEPLPVSRGLRESREMPVSERIDEEELSEEAKTYIYAGEETASAIYRLEYTRRQPWYAAAVERGVSTAEIFGHDSAIEKLIKAGRIATPTESTLPAYIWMRPTTAKGVRRSLATRVPEGTPRKDIDKSRFLKHMLLNEEFTPEDRAELEKYSEYEIQRNPKTEAEVKAILNKNGPKEAENMFFRNDPSIIPAARIPLGITLHRLHLAAIKKVKNAKERFAHQDIAMDIMKKIADMGKESGEVSQSFVMAYSGEMLEMEGGAGLLLNRMVHDTIQKEVKQLPVTITEVKQATERAQVEDIDEALLEKRIQERLGVILHRLGVAARNGLPARLRNADNQRKWQAWRAKNQEILAQDVRFAALELSLEGKIEVATAFGTEILFESKTLNYGDWSAKMKAKFGAGIAPFLERVWDESSILADSTMRKKVEPLGAKAEPKAKKRVRPTVTMTAEASRLIRDWLAAPMEPAKVGEPTEQRFEELTQPTLPIQKTIISSLADLGMTEKEGFKLINEIQREAVKRAKAKQETRLQQLLKGRPISPTSQKAIDRIMEISAIRRLDNAEIMDIFAEKMGLPKLTPELAGKLEELAEKIRKAPAGYPKIEAGRRLMAFMANQMPLNKWEVGWSMWYANMLSGYQTQERNLISTFNNVMMNLATSMIVDPKNAPYALVGLVSGIKRGWREAKFTLATGETPVHITPELKFEFPSMLERAPFKDWAKVFNNWKYVMRAMIAEDMIMFKPSQESRAMMLAADLAREEGLSGAQLWGRVEEIMGITKKQLAEYEQQAILEGFTGLRLQHRIDELAERQRPGQIQTEAIDYAKRATFNYQPEGLVGYLGEKIRQTYSHAPFVRLIVPFTRIVANVTNTTVDYSPWGFVRAKFGIRQISGEMRTMIGHERAQRQAKAFIGTALMVAAYALDVLNDDDDEEEKKFAIYAGGTGSSAKNNQLRALGWKPWSIKIGKYYLDYQLTPFAIAFGIIGSIRDAERWRKLDEKSIWERASFSVLRSLSVITDMSFLSGLNQFMEMVNVDSPEKAARNARTFIARSTVGAVVPNIFKQLDRTFDPMLRDNSTFIEAMMREIPIASHLNKPRLNVLGETIPQTTGPVSLVISPAKDDPLWKLLIKHEAWISVPRKEQYIGKRRMTESEFYRFIKYRGASLRERIEQNMTQLGRLKKEQFNNRIDEYTRHATRKAKNKIRYEAYLASKQK